MKGEESVSPDIHTRTTESELNRDCFLVSVLG